MLKSFLMFTYMCMYMCASQSQHDQNIVCRITEIVKINDSNYGFHGVHVYVHNVSINQAPAFYFCLRNLCLRSFSVLTFLSSSATVEILYTDIHRHLCSCLCTEGSCLSTSVYCSVNSRQCDRRSQNLVCR